jgi:hypothetical protein
VRRVRTTGKQLRFRLGPREKDLLLTVLRLYPCVPPVYQPLSKAAAVEESSQQLLDEALAEQRAENRRQLNRLLADPKRLAETQTGWQLSLSPADAEWLLQVLNDVRVGSWAILGSPEDGAGRLDAATLPHVWAMNLAGAFQMELLAALEGDA